jgi:hypothetical protein
MGCLPFRRAIVLLAKPPPFSSSSPLLPLCLLLVLLEDPEPEDPAGREDASVAARWGAETRTRAWRRHHPSPASGRPLGSRNKKTLAALAEAAATVSTEAAPATTAAGNSSGAVAGVACRSQRPPSEQRPAYTLVNGYTTFLAPLRAGCDVRLPLPFRFVNTMGGDVLTHAIV